MVDEVDGVPAGVRRRWVLPALGLVAAVLFGYVATHRYPAPPPTAPPDPARQDVATALPRLTGDRGAGPAGLRVLVSGPYPQILDLHTGRAAPVPGLRLTAGQRARLQPVPAGTVATVATPGSARTRSVLLPATGGRPVPLGEDVRVLPTRTGGLLVSSYARGGTSVLSVDRAGRRTGSWVRPGTVTPLRDTAAGLVAARSGTVPGAELLLLDPRTGQPRRRLAARRIAVAVGPASVAHLTAGCARSCAVTITDLAAGRSRDYLLPPGSGGPAAGAFSPDGRRLALAVPGQYRNGRLTVVPGYAEVLDLRSGQLLRVPGVETQAGRQPDLSWSAVGSVLVLGVWSADRGHLATWSPERPADPLRLLPVEPPGDDRSASVAVLP